ncbi:hypothetical protein BGX27_007357 [Mortierella sp. AM989]|nr:hypothetical protein BGX27_007357 [Mortierella sp. AM989]
MTPFPIAVDPSRVIAFAAADTTQTVEEQQSFQQLFSEFDHAQNTNNHACPSKHSKPALKMYIVRQPIPAKQRRGLVENRNWMGLEHFNEENAKDTVVVAQKIKGGSDSSIPIISDDISNNTSAQEVAASQAIFQSKGAWSHAYLNMIASPDSGDISGALCNADFHDQQPENEDNFGSNDDEDDEYEDEDDHRPSKKHRTKAYYLPHSFRPRVTEEGKIQYEIWVVAFLTEDLGETIRSDDGIEPLNSDVLVITPRQKQISFWANRVSQLLGTRLMEGFVWHEVYQGRIGIDYKQIIDEKRNSRKPGRRIIR